MTTIAYKDGIMAADTASSSSDVILTRRMQKLFTLSSGAILGMAGEADSRSLRALLDNVKFEREFPSSHELKALEQDYAALLVLPSRRGEKGGLFKIGVYSPDKDRDEWTAEVIPRIFESAALGSGREFALGAMAHGADAIGAVKIASSFDVYSGGGVQWLSIGESLRWS